jgi:hypothetical protein
MIVVVRIFALIVLVVSVVAACQFPADSVGSVVSCALALFAFIVALIPEDMY